MKQKPEVEKLNSTEEIQAKLQPNIGWLLGWCQTRSEFLPESQ